MDGSEKEIKREIKDEPDVDEVANGNATDITAQANNEPNICALCQKYVPSKSMRFHVLKEHFSKPLYKCTKCDRDLNRRSNIVCHWKSMHKTELDVRVKFAKIVENCQELSEKQKLCFPLNKSFVKGYGRKPEKTVQCLLCQRQVIPRDYPTHVKTSHFKQHLFRCR